MAYHKIDSDSANSITSALDFFHIPPTNVSVSSAKTFEILPSNPIQDTPYHFRIYSSENYIDLSKCYIFTEFKIGKKVNGVVADLEAADNVAPIQLLGQTFFNNMRVSINGREIYNSNSLLAYKSYMTHELSYSPAAKQGYLNAAGYYPENTTNLQTGIGHTSRRALFANSQTVQLIAKIDSDIFNQNQFLISHCQMELELTPNEGRFLLVAPNVPANTEYFIELTSLKLYVKKLSLTDGLALDIARKLDLNPARYAVRKSMMKSFFINEGYHQYFANIYSDQIPRKVVIGLVANSDFLGDVARSPFNFQPFNLREISLIANGRMFPNVPFDLDYTKGRYVRPFNEMNDALGFNNTLESNGITFAQFGNTHCLYVFNLTNSGEDQPGLFDLIKNGSTSVQIKFNAAVPAGGITMIVLGEMDSLIMLDKNRTISSDTTI
jgi:hypothetical protein